MAAYTDTPLVQILKDLQVKNPSLPVSPLNAADFTLTDVVEDLSYIGSGRNTRGKVTCINPAAGYIDYVNVYYKRLDVATLYGALPTTVDYPGAANQSTTLYALMDKIDAAISAGLKSEIDDFPINLTRTNQSIQIAPRTSSQKAIGSISFTVRTVGVNINTFPSDMTGVFFLDDEVPLSNNDNLNQEILDRILVANGYSAGGLSSSDVTIYFYNSNNDAWTVCDVYITTQGLFFSGNRQFVYKRRSFYETFPQVLTVYTELRDMNEVITSCFEGMGILAPVLPANMGTVPANQMGLENVLSPTWADRYWQANTLSTAPQMSILSGVVTELQVIFDIRLTSSNYVQFLAQIYDTPLQFQVLSTNSSFPYGTIQLDASGQSVEELYVGDYTLQLLLPDCRDLKIGGETRSLQFSPYSRITRVRKIRGMYFNATFQSVTTLTTIDAACFSDEGHMIVDMSNMFNGCTALTTYPAGLLDTVTRCTDYSGMFSGTGLTSVPADMFKNLPYLFNAMRYTDYLFRDTSIATIPGGTFTAVNSMSFRGTFASMTNLLSVGTAVWTGVCAPTQAWSLGAPKPYPEPVTSMEGTFYGCTHLQTINPLALGSLRDGVNYVDVGNTFEGCTNLASVPELLFNNLKAWVTDDLDYLGAPNQFYQTFKDCTSLQNVPVNLFSRAVNWVALSGTFYGSGLNVISDGLINGNSDLKALTETFVNTKITNVPLTLFEGCGNLTHLSSLFGGCTQITLLPALTQSQGVLHNLGQLQDTSWMFYGTGLTVFPPILITGTTPYIQRAGHMFEGCTALQGIGASAISEYNFSASNAPSVFKNCTTLFDYGTLPAWAKA